ncbi:MAG TPA: 2-amino-4-hydroxy-6-hydroxymethyldihydropteridine diphosphokinase [Catalimonadaceae bacterium]|nr:2-amino-4-hydroxy-6-hydroxymethyldihydropteridine diphosphokinase [Catalimonadaceae bacterium]HPI11534.1 2-amino-4-hydroxy-6-hydroxymethyldihydropteridine diphosphokinase [Catalimonadaceae bacterium]
MAELLILSLGSNLGDRTSALRQAITDLGNEVGILLGISPVFETEPFAATGHPPYLNLVAAFSSRLEPMDVLTITQKIEQMSGRKTKGDLSPRIIDIDLISFGRYQIQNEQLVLPHPRMHLRQFVLKPMLELCPFWKNPVTGISLADIQCVCQDSSWVTRHSNLKVYPFGDDRESGFFELNPDT